MNALHSIYSNLVSNTASIVVTLDTTPPRVTINSPADVAR